MEKQWQLGLGDKHCLQLQIILITKFLKIPGTSASRAKQTEYFLSLRFSVNHKHKLISFEIEKLRG